MVYRYLSQFKLMLVLAFVAVFGAHVAAAQTAFTFPIYYNGVSIGILEGTMTSSQNSCGPNRAYIENFYTFSGWFINGSGYSGGGGVPTTEAGDITETSGTGCPALGWTPALPYTLPFTSHGYLSYQSAPGAPPQQLVVTDYEVMFYGNVAYLTKCANSCS
jgi:hypothetical protein